MSAYMGLIRATTSHKRGNSYSQRTLGKHAWPALKQKPGCLWIWLCFFLPRQNIYACVGVNSPTLPYMHRFTYAQLTTHPVVSVLCVFRRCRRWTLPCSAPWTWRQSWRQARAATPRRQRSIWTEFWRGPCQKSPLRSGGHTSAGIKHAGSVDALSFDSRSYWLIYFESEKTVSVYKYSTKKALSVSTFPHILHLETGNPLKHKESGLMDICEDFQYDRPTTFTVRWTICPVSVYHLSSSLSVFVKVWHRWFLWGSVWLPSESALSLPGRGLWRTLQHCGWGHKTC